MQNVLRHLGLVTLAGQLAAAERGKPRNEAEYEGGLRSAVDG